MINKNKILDSKKYEFLNTNQDISNIIYLALSGSHGYGTNVENSDIDLRGVLIEQDKYLFGLKQFEQFEELETDTVIYGLKKFIKLCAEANPNTLELLGVNEDSIVIMTEKGKLIRDNSDLFLSKRVIQSFGNYATAQLRRLQNSLCHDKYNEDLQKKHLKNTLTSQLEYFKTTYTSFDNGSIKLTYDENTGELNMDIDLKKYPLNDFVKIYSEMANTIKTYNKLNHRNRKKDEKHLYKHAMHLIRLLITGMDILDGKGIITKREKEHDFLMDLRNGIYTFEQVFDFVDKYQAMFETKAKNTKLPNSVDYNKIDNFIIDLYKK